MSTTYSPFVNELKEKMEIEGVFLAKIVQLHMDKNGRPYLNLILMDKTGEVEARVWDNAAKLADEVHTQDVVKVAGRVNIYQGRKQLVLEAVMRAADGSHSMDRFVASTVYDVNKMFSELVELLSTIEDPFAKQLALKTLEDPEVKKKVLRAPAAKSVHHAYAGGLLEHTLSVCRILDQLAQHYQSYYGKAVSRDMMLVGGLFHDIGKIFELSYERGTEYTIEGQLIGHHVQGCELVDRICQLIPQFPAEVRLLAKHMILAHHGKLEYGSPKLPHTVEALLVHYVDDLDSKVNTILAHIGADSSNSDFTVPHRLFEHPFLKPKVKPEFKGRSPGRE